MVNYRLKKVGLFFGTFNPIHIGHLIIASYMVNFTDIDELWFIVSPQSPFKKKSTLLSNYHRLEMVEMAIEKQENMCVSDIEFRLPLPSYTINTLAYLKERYSNNKFVLIMGADNLATINKWKNYEIILQDYEIYVYPRPNVTPGEYASHPSVKITSAPIIEISSSFIRDAIKNKKNVSFFLPDKVYQYIKDMHFYE